jgi:hypothetical protein
MNKLIFKISFVYEIIPNSVLVDLSAEIEMIAGHIAIVRTIKRINSSESSLLPEFNLIKTDDKWTHADTGKESNIGTVIGKTIDRYLTDMAGKDSFHKSNETY